MNYQVGFDEGHCKMDAALTAPVTKPFSPSASSINEYVQA